LYSKYNSMAKKMTYKEAYEELIRIASSLENGEQEIDQLASKIKRASELVKFCKEKLRSIENEVNSEIAKNNDL